MKVLLVPYTPGSNPYLDHLAGGLEAEGVAPVLVETGPPVGLLRAVRVHGRPDVLHLQWQHRFFRARTAPGAALRSLAFLLEVLVLKILGTRVCWTVHNLVHHSRERADLELFSCRLLARLVDRLVVHCPEVVSRVAEAYRVDGKRITVIPHGPFFAGDTDLPTRQAARSRLDLPEEPRIFLFFGFVRPYKGILRLLRAFRAVGTENVRLLVVGRPIPTEYGESVRTLAAEDPRAETRFGFVPEDRLRDYVRASDLVVLPYRDILTSGAGIFAASCGRPILAPELGCLKNFPDEAAFRFDPDRESSLRDALRRAGEASLESMGEEAREYANAHSWDEIGQRTARLYRGL